MKYYILTYRGHNLYTVRPSKTALGQGTYILEVPRLLTSGRHADRIMKSVWILKVPIDY